MCLRLFTLCPKNLGDSIAISPVKAISVPGSRHTAVLRSSGALKPRVPVPKFLVVSLSPTAAGRDAAPCRLYPHMARNSCFLIPSTPSSPPPPSLVPHPCIPCSQLPPAL